MIERHTTEIAYSKHNHKETLDNIELLCEGFYNFKIDFAKEITELKGCNEEKMSLIKAYNKDAMYKTELLNDKLTAVTSGYDDTLKDMLHTMNTIFNSQMSLKTEFNERNNYVPIGSGIDGSGKYTVCYADVRDVNSISKLLSYIPYSYQGYVSFEFNLSFLKYCLNIKIFDIYALLLYANQYRITTITNNDKSISFTYYNVGDIHTEKQSVKMKEIIQYIRSIRPDIELTWNDITI